MPAWVTRCCLLVGLTGSLAAAGAALAQDPDVHVDPDTPAGKEYALPLDAARRDAAGGATASGGGSGDSAPLFGAGISRDGGGGGSGGAGASGSAETKGSSRGAEKGSAAGGADATQATRVVADGGGGLSAGLVTLLIALGVLAVGGLIGLSVRAVRGTHPAA